MYKVYISRVPDMELDQKVRQVLRENGFQCEDWQWRNVASDADIHNALKEADVYICYSSNEVGSLYEKRETDTALYNDITVVAIRLSATDRMCGGWAMVDLPPSVAIFNLEDASSLGDLPGFITEKIRKNGSGNDENDGPEAPYSGKEEYLYISFAEEDRPQAYRIISNMQSKGYRIWYDNGRSAGKRNRTKAEKAEGCCFMIALISSHYMENESCREEIGMVRNHDKNCLLVYLEKTKLSPGMAMRLLRVQAIHQYDCGSEQEFYDKLYSAKGIEAANKS